jgi:hypothetical protein
MNEKPDGSWLKIKKTDIFLHKKKAIGYYTQLPFSHIYDVPVI